MDHAPFEQYDYIDAVFENANDVVDYIEKYLPDFDDQHFGKYYPKHYDKIDFKLIKENLFDEDYCFSGSYHVALSGLEYFANQPDIDADSDTYVDGYSGVVQLVGSYWAWHFGIDFIDEENEGELASRLNYIRGTTVFNKALKHAELTEKDLATKENIDAFTKGLEKQRVNFDF